MMRGKKSKNKIYSNKYQVIQVFFFLFFFFLRESFNLWHPLLMIPDDSFLSSDQDINQLPVELTETHTVTQVILCNIITLYYYKLYVYCSRIIFNQRERKR